MDSYYALYRIGTDRRLPLASYGKHCNRWKLCKERDPQEISQNIMQHNSYADNARSSKCQIFSKGRAELRHEAVDCYHEGHTPSWLEGQHQPRWVRSKRCSRRNHKKPWQQAATGWSEVWLTWRSMSCFVWLSRCFEAVLMARVLTKTYRVLNCFPSHPSMV